VILSAQEEVVQDFGLGIVGDKNWTGDDVEAVPGNCIEVVNGLLFESFIQQGNATDCFSNDSGGLQG
jgi:hypothetical protein